MLQKAKELASDQMKVRAWLANINETDEGVIFEVINAMRTDPDYRTWIMKYSVLSSIGDIPSPNGVYAIRVRAER